MPRAHLEGTKQLTEFVRDWVMKVRKGKYHLFYTNTQEVILAPTTSTDPIIYGYALAVPEKVVEELKSQFDLGVTAILDWVWSADRMPGAER